jgi:flagellar protein FlaG
MGIQIASLYAGGISAAAQRELPKEKPLPLPIEQKAAQKDSTEQNVSAAQKAVMEQALASLPGNRQNAQALEKTAADLQHISLVFSSRLKFIIDHESNEILIKVIDNETDKVIKVLPPEELQRLHSRIRETFGVLFDRMV